MNEFKFLIHKQTGKCIDYEEYKDKEKNEELIKWVDKNKNGTWQYNSKTILSNGDFEIMYNSHLKKEQLESVLNICIEYFEECGHPEAIDKLIKKLNREGSDSK